MATTIEIAAAVIAGINIFRELGEQGKKYIDAIQGVTEDDVKAQLKSQHEAVDEMKKWLYGDEEETEG